MIARLATTNKKGDPEGSPLLFEWPIGQRE
jgi:hypothetical protein